jgi:RNA polymerase sigma-70 factor, ECF subfamily
MTSMVLGKPASGLGITTGPVEPVTSLIPACLAGEPAARERLARWCLARVNRTIYLGCGCGADKDDLVQITISKVFERLDTFRGDASFYVWLDRIAINVVRDHLRKKRHLFFVADPERHAVLEDESPNAPDREIDRYRLIQRLSHHFMALAPKYRIPLVLMLAHNYQIPEIAGMLDISCEAAKKRIQRGRAQLIARLERDPVCRSEVMEFAP